MFYEEGNAFNMYVRPQGYTQCVLVKTLIVNRNFIYKGTMFMRMRQWLDLKTSDLALYISHTIWFYLPTVNTSWPSLEQTRANLGPSVIAPMVLMCAPDFSNYGVIITDKTTKMNRSWVGSPVTGEGRVPGNLKDPVITSLVERLGFELCDYIFQFWLGFLLFWLQKLVTEVDQNIHTEYAEGWICCVCITRASHHKIKLAREKTLIAYTLGKQLSLKWTGTILESLVFILYTCDMKLLYDLVKILCVNEMD